MDVKLDNYIDDAPERSQIDSLSDLSEENIETLLKSGIDPEAKIAGSFMISDHSTINCQSCHPGVEVLPVEKALEMYDGLPEYWWKAITRDKDEFTRQADEHVEGGYFIRTEKGVHVDYPLQTCLYLEKDKLSQDVHNIVIAEEGSTLNILSGCASGPHVRSGLHVGISEIYVKKGATLSFTMVHNWADEMAVRPRTTVIVEEGGTYISNYICLKPGADIQMYPNAFLKGKESVATFNSVLLATPGSTIDAGSRVYLQAEGSRAEVVSRVISTGGKVYSRGHLIGEVPGVKGHLECDGLILSEKGLIHAIPELEARCSDLEMSHEAAVGKIAQEEIEYLMARGLSEDESRSLIIKGFLTLDIIGLPEELKKDIEEAVKQTNSESAM